MMFEYFLLGVVAAVSAGFWLVYYFFDYKPRKEERQERHKQPHPHHT
jgi:hypothetical protein